MAVFNNCTIVGIETVAGKSKKTGNDFRFHKLHLTAVPPAWAKSFEGAKVMTCNVNDNVMERDQLSCGMLIDVYEKNGVCDYIGESRA